LPHPVYYEHMWAANRPVNSFITDDQTALVPDFNSLGSEWCLYYIISDQAPDDMQPVSTRLVG